MDFQEQKQSLFRFGLNQTSQVLFVLLWETVQTIGATLKNIPFLLQIHGSIKHLLSLVTHQGLGKEVQAEVCKYVFV